MLKDLIHMFFPVLCGACGQPLFRNERILCFSCRYRLPKTNFHLQRNNPVEQLFWGRVPLKAAAACYFFRKEGKVQQLLHHLKYKGAAELGREVGRIYGKDLMASEVFAQTECVIPVPLSLKKLKIRGYNQSCVFGEGIASSMNQELIENGLVKIRHNESQTRKSRYERYENSADIFKVNEQFDLSKKHVLLVDDVVTTGATLEACTQALIKQGVADVRIACIAAALRNY